MPQRQQRQFPLGTAAAIVAVCIVAAVALMLLLRTGTPSLSHLDRPSGQQRPLVTSFVAKDPTGAASFEIDLPAAPDPISVAAHAGSDGSVSFGTVRLGGPQFGALFLVKGGQSWSTSARKALEKASAKSSPVGPIRRTVVGTTPAFARDFATGIGARLREFRFAHHGHIYGIGVLYKPADIVSLDTALAALQTLRWDG